MMLRRRMQQHERDRLQINYNKVPKDILYLTKTEAELKRDLVLCIETGDEFLQVQENELKRLRREHATCYQSLQVCQEALNDQNKKLNVVLERSSLNDHAMATLLRINKISAALELQDEKDRHGVFLMGKGDSSDRNSKQTTTLQIHNHGQKEPVIGIENNCLSHSNGPANDLVLKAFKMACLSYQPSEVPLESNTFTRTQLIEKKSDLVR